MYKILDRNKQFMGQAVPEWATAAAYTQGYWYFEESLGQEDGQRFQRIRGFDQGCGAEVKYGPSSHRGFVKAVKFSEAVEQDDPLPPAPESVRYYNSYILGNNDQHLTVEAAPEYPGEGLLHLLITPNSRSSRNVAPLSINMDADSALQLAHDLNRMANEIKRKEKRNA